MTQHSAPNGRPPRITPRRPFTIGPCGLIRITLGTTPLAALCDDDAGPRHDHRQTSSKPTRLEKVAARSLMVLAYSDRGMLDAHAAEAIAAAALLADADTEVVLIVFGACHDDVAALGADRVLVYPEKERHLFAPDASVQLLRACVDRYRPLHLLMPDRAGEADLGRRYAASSGKSIATQIVEIDAHHVAVYADGTRQFASRTVPDIVLLARNAVVPALPFVGSGVRIDATEIDALATGAGKADTRPARYRDLGLDAMDSMRLPLEEADAIVAGGNGVRDVSALERLAVALGAAVGASRVAVDDGRFTRDKQIGATGKTVEASVYVAFGISGAVQHLQGIKSCRHVIAVNTDASAPISKRANLLIVDDAERVIAALTDVIETARTAHEQSRVPSAATAVSAVAPSASAPRSASRDIDASIDENAGAVA
ncbi:electron transfer flavoprotein subunit alpha/FixB family protein [Robbsia sp. KACC 23696]|uniref:electron transfer flavoprotein subunit alpha/FixB family protein n=1 Tax=Robbsia sp. KACC 23696 TaxID=3149231 RepID=UPI00325BC426